MRVFRSPAYLRKRCGSGRAALLALLSACDGDGPTAHQSERRLSVDFAYATLAAGRSIPITVAGPDQAANAAAPILVVVRDRDGDWVFGERPTYSSSDARVATVSPAGLIRAVAPGRATVTVRLGRATAPIAVTVEPPYAVAVLGDPADAESRALGLSSAGHVVGWMAQGGEQRAFVWIAGRRTDLGPGVARAVNDSGVVVGESGGQPARWRQGRVETLYRDPDRVGTATGVNRAGTAVGTVWRERCPHGNCGWQALVIRDGEVQVLSTRLPEASGVNDREQVVGWFNDPDLNAQAFVYRDGRFTPLSPESLISRAYGVGDGGTVVGHRMTSPEAAGYEAVAWGPSGTPVPLGHFRRGNLSSARAVNASGVVVGWGNRCPNNCDDRVALRWHDGSVAALQDLVADSGWTILEATAVSDRGYIAAYGRHTSGGGTTALLLVR